MQMVPITVSRKKSYCQKKRKEEAFEVTAAAADVKKKKLRRWIKKKRQFGIGRRGWWPSSQRHLHTHAHTCDLQVSAPFIKLSVGEVCRHLGHAQLCGAFSEEKYITSADTKKKAIRWLLSLSLSLSICTPSAVEMSPSTEWWPSVNVWSIRLLRPAIFNSTEGREEATIFFCCCCCCSVRFPRRIDNVSYPHPHSATTRTVKGLCVCVCVCVVFLFVSPYVGTVYSTVSRSKANRDRSKQKGCPIVFSLRCSEK